ncbi:shikimate kinase [Zongyangia hominis]|uniref:Shikimate kinase n=1 Tax=Zongyangia hominis TaxID=2763677 RepID=A0A926EDJ8_9FIRM|nr:shikimate kinase [Zongyangia hominis]MBC8570234.1 shikimate kinase [Zongyangia hominis]
MLHNIVLCGFMGSGKTTIGKMLAGHLLFTYVDTDDVIEASTGMTVPQIFEVHGEEHYRDLEHAAVQDLTSRNKSQVIATGGGMMTFERNVELFHSHGDRVIFLDIPFDVCYKRIKDSDRPLVRNNTPEKLRELYNARRDLYLKACDQRITGLDSEAIVREIIQGIELSYTPESERF